MLPPLSTAGSPISVSQIGFEPGSHAVGVALSIPPERA